MGCEGEVGMRLTSLMSGCLASIWSHRISTTTRFSIRPYSLNNERSGAHVDA